jgi:hypothetical protein
LIQNLNQKCFEVDTVTKENRDLFVVQNCLVFPNNIITIDNDVYCEYKTDIFYIYGLNVISIGYNTFAYNLRVVKATFPSLTNIDDGAFISNFNLETVYTPLCTSLGREVFFLVLKLKTHNNATNYFK